MPILFPEKMCRYYLIAGISLLSACQSPLPEDKAAARYQSWSSYLGDPARSHYSSLDQIRPENVTQLEIAWTYQSGDASPENRSQIQCNPIIIDTILYATNPTLKLFALHAATGAELWTFDPDTKDATGAGVNRGVAYWTDGQHGRILYSSGAYLYAVDARTGKSVPEFGQNGKVDLREGLGRDPEKLFVISNTPGAVYKDLIIMGSRVLESPGAAPGHIRAYNARTGELTWTFHTIPQPGEYGYDTWPEEAWQYIGGANAWAGLSIDEEAGVVYAPTGSAAFDFYGGNRTGENLFANCVLALNAATGERIWHFQTVHHDLWDRDLPSPPNLLNVRQNGQTIPALAQVTKSGFVFLFNRKTGEPLFPIEERPVPASDLEGEQAWPTQPVPTRPAPFARQTFTEADLSDLFPENRSFIEEWGKKDRTPSAMNLREQLARVKTGQPFIPPSEQGNIMFPGFDGGAEWGGSAVDPNTGILYVNSNEMPWIFRMRKVEKKEEKTLAAVGENLYQVQCVQCHKSDRQGQSGVYPSLVNLQDRMSRPEVVQLLNSGRGLMPAFRHLSGEEKEALAAFLLGLEAESGPVTASSINQAEVPYGVGGFGRFLDERGYPAVKPPWGTLNAIDLNTGETLWQVPLGEFEELTRQGIPVTGTENYGGPVVTAGELIFIAATKDEKFRAFDKRTGKLLWETDLPAGGYATPATYQVDGRQYVVIACGGGKMNTRSGDTYVAFRLPEAGNRE
jgi:quinoprotein glucose dehydrogenase